VRACVRACVR